MKILNRELKFLEVLAREPMKDLLTLGLQDKAVQRVLSHKSSQLALSHILKIRFSSTII